MAKRKQLSEAERAAELGKLELVPKREGTKRADDLLRAMLNTPPEPFTPKPKPKKRATKRRA
jgi:hypothetical protein